MATNIECSQHIPIYTPEQVFEVGTRREMLPTDVEDFELDIQGDRFANGVAVQVCFVIPELRRNIHFNGHVKEFVQDEWVLVRAKSRGVANVDVWLGVGEHEEGGTGVDYGIKVAHHPLTRALEGRVKNILEKKVEIFASDFTSNVVNYLDDQAQTGSRRRKAA